MKSERVILFLALEIYGGTSLLDETYFSTKIYQYKQYYDQPGGAVTEYNNTELPLTY